MAQLAGPRLGLRQPLFWVAERGQWKDILLLSPKLGRFGLNSSETSPLPARVRLLSQHVGATAVNLNQRETEPTPTSPGFLIPTATPDG